ncbi:MAG: hypothetical protein JF888_01330 [Candidatus Dormibacteraeota bacterium]|uniref:O-methyltransferase C-terminal domain-containing protein n=1 Tax=Candidatus Dormiibacter inghamiae TaxID=3127013 RepID=A0A934KDU1_9BACT|nr:hypothetical protein [Candidatus Dormibacteraeota bacterium]
MTDDQRCPDRPNRIYDAGNERDIWSYRREHPDEAVIFNRAMNSLTGSMTESLVEGLDFSRFRKIVDVGAGGGAMLVAIQRRYAEIKGVLFDLPHVVADTKSFVNGSGLSERIRARRRQFPRVHARWRGLLRAEVRAAQLAGRHRSAHRPPVPRRGGRRRRALGRRAAHPGAE